jgi:DNA-binding HxlR family transcriptional regulator
MNQALKYNIYQQHCPARLFFEKIADKWVLLIINVLQRNSALQFTKKIFKVFHLKYFLKN